MGYCDCDTWTEEETNEESVFNWDKIRGGNFCPFCGKSLIDPNE